MQARGHFFHRDQPGRRQNARLPHPSAEAFAKLPPARDRGRGPEQHRADRRSQPFREAEHHGVGVPRNPRDGMAGRDRRIEDARAVDVNLQAACVRTIADIVDRGEIVERAAVHVVRMLQRHQRRGGVKSVAGLDLRFNLRPGQQAIGRRDGPDQASGKHGRHRELPVENVRAIVANHFLAGLGVELHGDGVGHRAGGHEQRGFLLENFRGALF